MMPEYNLLTESWIPVQERQKIILKELLCGQDKRSLVLNRDDMEMACLQLIVCIVQVIFMPKDFEQLQALYDSPMEKEDYDKGISSFKDWFDVLHPEYPFMQTKIDFKNKKSKVKSLQKLFIGLPAGGSASSNAHFNRTNEVEELDLGQTAIALFQQATNGHSLGGNFFSVGLKGSIPVTTLIYDPSQDLRKTIWCNICHRKFLIEKQLIDPDNPKIEEPTWVKPASFNEKEPEYTHKIGLMRGLFFQPAKVQLEISKEGKAIHFFTESGLSYTKNFWGHPHTPMDIKKFKENDKDKKPYMALSFKDGSLWTQMLGFLYAKQPDQERHSRALAVDSYMDGIGHRKHIYLAVGGYIKGKSTESVFGRKHEMYTLKSGWNDRYADIKELVNSALEAKKCLKDSIYVLGQNLKSENSSQDQKKSILKKKQKESSFIKSLKEKAKQIYF